MNHETDDEQFEQAVRAGEFPLHEFNHRAHLRFAWLLLRRAPLLEACITMRETLKAFAARAGKPALYHETVTVAFMSVLAECMADSGAIGFAELIAAHPELCRRNLLDQYYAPEVLASPRARGQFILAAGNGLAKHPAGSADHA